jgi:hypothetical protein
MAKAKDDVNVKEPKVEHMTPAEFKARFNPGREQWARYGGVGEWDIGPLKEEFKQNGYRPELGIIEVCGKEILDGNRRGTAVVELSAENPTFAKIKIPVRIYPEDLTREEKEEIRLRAARGTKAWSRADYLHAMVNIVLDYPGDCPESYMAKRIGLHRITEQFPRAVKRNAKGEVETDAGGNPVFQNRQGPFQDAKRLARLPGFVREAFYKGVDGKGPAIPSRALTTLTANWENDRKANPDVAKATTLDELVEVLPKSELASTLKPILGSVTAPGRGVGKGVMSAKDMDAMLSTFAGKRVATADISLLARKPGYAKEDAMRVMVKLHTRIEELVSGDKTASELMAELAKVVAE